MTDSMLQFLIDLYRTELCPQLALAIGDKRMPPAPETSPGTGGRIFDQAAKLIMLMEEAGIEGPEAIAVVFTVAGGLCRAATDESTTGSNALLGQAFFLYAAILGLEVAGGSMWQETEH